MAMNKKEAAQFSDALQLAELNFALRWTEKIEKDVPVPKGYQKEQLDGRLTLIPYKLMRNGVRRYRMAAHQ